MQSMYLASILDIFQGVLTFNSNNQWKKKIRQWGLNVKYVKSLDYQAILRKEKQREANGPGKQTAFKLHGRNVRPDKVQRYRKSLAKKRPEGTEKAIEVDAGMYVTIITREPANIVSK